MTDLTQDWKDGKLSAGWYWVQGSRTKGICAYTAEYLNNMYRPSNGERIIAPVPTFEEWQASEKYNKHLEEKIKIYERKDKQATETSIAYNELLEENAHLKELLKECIPYTQNTKNEQQKDLCITSEQLTEQWKKSELPYAEYYIKLGGGEYTNDVWDIDGWQSFNKKGDVVVEVLAPVPSYDEWKATYNCMLENEVLRLKNAQLKELLKECKEVIKNVDTYYGNYDSTNGYLVINKIDEVLK